VAKKEPVLKPAKKAFPSAKVGNYRAGVDTVGMDAEMKATMGFGKVKPKRRGK
jgi:hypothetical protein